MSLLDLGHHRREWTGPHRPRSWGWLIAGDRRLLRGPGQAVLISSFAHRFGHTSLGLLDLLADVTGLPNKWGSWWMEGRTTLVGFGVPPPWPSGPLTDRIVCPLCATWWGCQHTGGAHTAPGRGCPPWVDEEVASRGVSQGYDITLVGFGLPAPPGCHVGSARLSHPPSVGARVRLHLVEAAGWGPRMRGSGALEALLPPDSVPKPLAGCALSILLASTPLSFLP